MSLSSSLYSNFRLADLVTIMNGVCGLNSLFACARFLIDPTAANRPSLWLGLALPVAGFGFDVFDGKIARWMHSSSMLGQEMDSLADLVRAALVLILLGRSPPWIGRTLRPLPASLMMKLSPSPRSCSP